MTVYFAHSMRIYRTPEAKRCRTAVERYAQSQGLAILDPEDLDWMGLVRQLGSHDRVYDHVIQRSSEVVVREHVDHIGRGAYDEVLRALLASKPVWRLAPDCTTLHSVIAADIVNAGDWKIRYARLRWHPEGRVI